MFERILVIRGGAIGDFILMLPALAALRRLQSSTAKPRLEILGRPSIASLALDTGLADAVRSIDQSTLAAFFTSNAPLDQRQIDYFDSFDLIVSYAFDPDRVFANRLASCTSAKLVIAPHRPNESLNTHASDVFLQPLHDLGIHDANPEPTLPYTAPSQFAHENAQARWLALHPGSGSPTKNWPHEKWAQLLQTLIQRTRLQLLLVGGEAEGDRLHHLAAGLPLSRVQLVSNVPLTELAQRLRCCAAFCGHDSGITHLAGAIGLPGLALWGPTNPNIWRPRTSKIHVLLNPSGLANLPVQEVYTSLTDLSSIDIV